VATHNVLRFSGLRRDVGPVFHENVRSCRQDGAPIETPFLVGYAAFSLLFENNPHPMWIHDLTTLRFLAVNEAAIRNYMYSGEEFATLTIEDVHPPQEKEVVRERMGDTCLSSGAARIWKHLRKDGTVFDAEITSHDMMFCGRKARLVLATDVTAREQTREELRETEERFRDLFDHSNDIVFTADLDGNFTSLNKAGETITGYSTEEALSGNVSQLLGPRCLEIARGMRERKLTEGGQTTYEVEIAKKDGQLGTLAVRTSLIYKDEVPVGVRGIAQDITERKQLEDRLRQSQKMESLGRLAGGVAHDFNNLLGVIIGFSEILRDRLKSDEPLSGFAEETLKAGRQAAQLTRQLLAFSRQQVLQPRILDLNDSINNIETILRRLIREDIELVIQAAPALGHVKVDPGQVEQVIINLAVNARDAMPLGGKLTIKTSNVDLEEAEARRYAHAGAGRYVMVTVCDTGIGMDEKTQARIFEPFFTTKRLGKGTGLGLATVYGIVEQSGGHISVRSRVGKGTTFRVCLPCVKEQPAESTATECEIGSLEGKETILLVDDAEPFRRLVRTLLETNGYSVLEAASGSEASKIASTHQGPIHLLLTDVVMPQVNGYQLSDHLRFLRPEMKVLCMSGYAGFGTGQFGDRPGMALLPKPFGKETLFFMLRKTFEGLQPVGEMQIPADPWAGVHNYAN
jgi:two-component system cell cycle sensor histidine kinase/response regulator CckA